MFQRPPTWDSNVGNWPRYQCVTFNIVSWPRIDSLETRLTHREQQCIPSLNERESAPDDLCLGYWEYRPSDETESPKEGGPGWRRLYSWMSSRAVKASLFSGSLENKYARRDVSREWEGWGMSVDTWWRDLGRASPFKYSTRTSSNRLTNLTPTCLCSSPLTWLKIHNFSSMIGVHGLQTQSCDDLTGKCNGALLRTHARPWSIFCGAYARAFLTISPSMNVHKWVLSVPCLNIWVQMIRA